MTIANAWGCASRSGPRGPAAQRLGAQRRARHHPRAGQGLQRMGVTSRRIPTTVATTCAKLADRPRATT